MSELNVDTAPRASGIMHGSVGADPRAFEELRESGLLWLINATVFHPRGLALAFVVRNGESVGWALVGDGAEPWQFHTDGLDELYARAQATLDAATRRGDAR